ncbi:hypothetical protein ZWY2020_037878 [Hordeum vulgare]|nr:hypothetical protein ZWY2020_037878 [Hordeum vulgare]
MRRLSMVGPSPLERRRPTTSLPLAPPPFVPFLPRARARARRGRAAQLSLPRRHQRVSGLLLIGPPRASPPPPSCTAGEAASPRPALLFPQLLAVPGYHARPRSLRTTAPVPARARPGRTAAPHARAHAAPRIGLAPTLPAHQPPAIVAALPRGWPL